jgi:hypothetical protein
VETKNNTKDLWNKKLVLWKDKENWQTLSHTNQKKEKPQIIKIREEKDGIIIDMFPVSLFSLKMSFLWLHTITGICHISLFPYCWMPRLLWLFSHYKLCCDELNILEQKYLPISWLLPWDNFSKTELLHSTIWTVHFSGVMTKQITFKRKRTNWGKINNIEIKVLGNKYWLYVMWLELHSQVLYLLPHLNGELIL